MTPQRRRDPVMWAIVAVALVLRLAFVLLYPQAGERCGDCQIYEEVGAHVAEGRGFVGGFAAETFAGPSPLGHAAPEVGMGPVYPLFVAAVFRVAGHELAPVRIAQAVLGAITVLLVFQIARAVSRRAAIAAAILAACTPALVAYTGLLLTETMLALLLALTVWSSMNTTSSGGWSWAVAAGLSCGACVLLRTECASMLPIVAILVWWRARRRAFALAALITAVACAAVSVWTIRNYRVFHQPIIVSAAGGETLWISTTDWNEWHFDDPELRRLVAGQDYVGQNHVLGREAMRRIQADPLAYLRYCLRRIPQFWITSHTSYVRGFNGGYGEYAARGKYGRLAVKLILLTFSLATLTLAGIGLAVTRRSVGAWLVVTPIAAIAIVHVFLYSSPRYQVPVLPLLCVFAGAALDRLAARLGRT